MNNKTIIEFGFRIIYETNNYMNEAPEELWRSRRVLPASAYGLRG